MADGRWQAGDRPGVMLIDVLIMRQQQATAEVQQ
jgi:hypothetical protein